MLILTRRIGESLIIGEDIQVIVLGIKGGQVRIGIQAEKEIPVNRLEIYENSSMQQEDEIAPRLHTQHVEST